MATNPTRIHPADKAATIAPVILLAEDDPVQRTVTTKLLEHAGYEVVAAENGAGAIALTEHHQPDLLLIDALMPHVDGFEAIAAIRSRPEYATTPTIVISGLEDAESRVKALAIGADDFMVKPIDPSELLARVRAQLRSVDAWFGRVTEIIGAFRAIRHRIGEDMQNIDPTELVRAMVDRFPSALACSTLVAVDEFGVCTWTDAVARPDFDGLDLGAVTVDQTTTLRANDRGVCPLCGSASGGDVLATAAGSWRTGRAVLLVGCLEQVDPARRAVMLAVADACNAVLSEQRQEQHTERELARWLDEVIESRAFRMVFQPIVDMRSGRVLAHEALVRFDDGTTPPEALRVANALGRRDELELALVDAALRDAVDLHDGARLHVNVSPSTAVCPELGDLVSGTRRQIVIEITEDALFSGANADTLRGAMPASCLLAADDVGAGYAGLSQLLEYRPDIIKIDRAVVSGVDTDAARQALVAGLVQFAQVTRSFVVAEGVERAEEWHVLREMGVDFGQGYYFARPMSADDAARVSSWTLDDRAEQSPVGAE